MSRSVRSPTPSGPTRSASAASSPSSPRKEARELAGIYEARGLEPALAAEVARQLMSKDALGTHLRDELGMADETAARPIQAALTSAATFAVGAALPLAAASLVPIALVVPAVSVVSLLFLALLGAVGARAGGANVVKATARVAIWGALAMAATAVIGALFGTQAG